MTKPENIINFPTWKANCTPIEKLLEVLQYLESKPDDVKNILIIYNNQEGVQQFCCDKDLTIIQAIGMLALAQHNFAKEI